jgi:hypothetical protein
LAARLSGFVGVLFFITLLAGVMGDCERGPGDDCQVRREAMMRHWMFGEVLLLVGVGWIFYRREMKDGEF